jgi:hypothetical protein
MADLPKNETVLLITGVNRLMHSPRIVEGKTSSTGKTISVEKDLGHRSKTYRLDTETILNGRPEIRKGAYYELYTKEDFLSTQRGNLARGPVAGANEVTDADELPEQNEAVL